MATGQRAGHQQLGNHLLAKSLPQENILVDPWKGILPTPPTQLWAQVLSLAGFHPPFLGSHQALHAGPSPECLRWALLRSHSTGGETEAEAGERSTRKHAAEAGLETRVPREAWMLCSLLGAAAKGTLLLPPG